MRSAPWLWILPLFPLACTKPQPPADASAEAATPQSAEAHSTATAADQPQAQAAGLPTECADRKDGLCLPSSDFVRRLCEGTFADVALVMLRSDSPWTRGYLRGRTEAWNASGGASVAGWLEFDEEVLLLRHRASGQGGFQVSGTDGYDALRWNGSCVTLTGDEVTLDPPPKRKHSRVEWRWLGTSMREVLRQDSVIDQTYLARKKECKGATMGEVSQKCEQLDQQLVDVIVAHVREGGDLGTPEAQP